MSSTSKLKSKLNKMATTGKKRKRKATKTLSARRRTRSTPAPKKRRRRGLSSGGGRMSLMKAGSNTFGGAMGGAIYTAPAFFIGLPWWAKLGYGIAGSVALNMFKFDSAGSGMAGAMVNDLARSQMGTMLKDGDLEDAEFVDANTLSDTGFEDEAGNQVLCDDDGNVFALNDNGDYEMVGTMQDLPVGRNMQEVSMQPLTDAYALSSPYDLSQGGY